MISGRYDPTFWYEFTEDMFEDLRRKGILLETMTLSCGHYSLELAPFAYPAGLRLGLFLLLVPAMVFCICMMLIMFFPDSVRIQQMSPH